MSVQALLDKVKSRPETVEFADVIEIITAHYQYTPSRFSNGDVISEAGTNEGSCKILAFAKMHGLTADQTLACFGRYYRDDVLGNPAANDHANIRQFMKTGWASVQFDALPLFAR